MTPFWAWPDMNLKRVVNLESELYGEGGEISDVEKVSDWVIVKHYGSILFLKIFLKMLLVGLLFSIQNESIVIHNLNNKKANDTSDVDPVQNQAMLHTIEFLM